MGRYRKIDTRTWNDQKFNELSDYGKLVFFLLLTHPHLTSIGAMRATLPGLASELHWPYEKFKNAFDESFLKGMVHYDELSSLMWLPNFLKYNRPESPNVVRSWDYALDYLPECSLRHAMINHLREHVLARSQSFHKAFPKAFRMSMPIQEQEQKQEQEEKILSGKPDDISKSISQDDQENQNSIREEAIEVLKFFNKKTGRNFRLDNSNLKFIIAQLKSGASIEDCRKIIIRKYNKWNGDPKMDDCIRPATLFGEKFGQYLGELVIAKKKED